MKDENIEKDSSTKKELSLQKFLNDNKIGKKSIEYVSDSEVYKKIAYILKSSLK